MKNDKTKTDPYRENTYEQPKPNQARDELELLAVRGRMEQEEKQKSQREKLERARQEMQAEEEAQRRAAPLKEQAAAKARRDVALSLSFEPMLSFYFMSLGLFVLLPLSMIVGFWFFLGGAALLVPALFVSRWLLRLRKERTLSALCQTPWSTKGVEELLSVYVDSGVIEVSLEWKKGAKALEASFVQDLCNGLGIEASIVESNAHGLLLRSPRISCIDKVWDEALTGRSGWVTTYQNRSLFQWVWRLHNRLLHRLHSAYGLEAVCYTLVERKKTVYD